MRKLAAAALLCAAWSLAAAAGEPTIASREGRVGAVRLGEIAAETPDLLRQDDGTYRAADGGVACRVDAEGRITEISITTPDLVTERLIRARRSTLADVVRAYGSPTRSTHEGLEVVLLYRHLRFHFLRHALETVGEHATVERVVLPGQVPARLLAKKPKGR